MRVKGIEESRTREETSRKREERGRKRRKEKEMEVETHLLEVLVHPILILLQPQPGVILLQNRQLLLLVRLESRLESPFGVSFDLGRLGTDVGFVGAGGGEGEGVECVVL
jgi:hypothetical protein